MSTIKTNVTVDVHYVKAYINRQQRKLVLIMQDNSPESPREWDNIGTIVYKHRHYKLGEVEITGDVCNWIMDFCGLSERKQAKLIKDSGGYNNDLLNACMSELDTKYFWLPLYLYDHGGTSISTGSFIGRAQHAEWDSGMCGFIYMAKADLKKHGYTAKWLKTHYPGKTMQEKIEEFLAGEIKTYDQWMQGDVYGYKVIEFDEDHFDPDGSLYVDEGEETDSCWGFFGDCDDKESGWLSEAGVETKDGELIGG